MIPFRHSKVDKKGNNTPVISDREIDEWAEHLLNDYKPQLLKEPGRIRYEHFIERYLEATIEYHDIFNDDQEKPIWGATAFNEEYLKVFDREHERVGCVKVSPRTIILDNYVTEPGKEGLALFTALHEAGHLWMHEEVFCGSHVDQLCFFEPQISPVVCCRSNFIENFGGTHRTKRTPHEWREHQADYFASAIAMPNKTFIPLAKQLLRERYPKTDRIVLGADIEADGFAEETLPKMLTSVLGVSKKAAYVKLKKSRLVVERKQHEAEMAQGVLF